MDTARHFTPAILSNSFHKLIEMKPRMLLLPGLHNSGPAHWQTTWESGILLKHFPSFVCSRIARNEWIRPQESIWTKELEENMEANQGTPAIFAAHSLGCLSIDFWVKSGSKHVKDVKGALLVAPPDNERPDFPKDVAVGFDARVGDTPLPFHSITVASEDDRYARFQASKDLAKRWNSEFVGVGKLGHINGESALGSWPVGLEILRRLTSKVGL